MALATPALALVAATQPETDQWRLALRMFRPPKDSGWVRPEHAEPAMGVPLWAADPRDAGKEDLVVSVRRIQRWWRQVQVRWRTGCEPSGWDRELHRAVDQERRQRAGARWLEHQLHLACLLNKVWRRWHARRRDRHNTVYQPHRRHTLLKKMGCEAFWEAVPGSAEWVEASAVLIQRCWREHRICVARQRRQQLLAMHGLGRSQHVPAAPRLPVTAPPECVSPGHGALANMESCSSMVPQLLPELPAPSEQEGNTEGGYAAAEGKTCQDSAECLLVLPGATSLTELASTSASPCSPCSLSLMQRGGDGGTTSSAVVSPSDCGTIAGFSGLAFSAVASPLDGRAFGASSSTMSTVVAPSANVAAAAAVEKPPRFEVAEPELLEELHLAVRARVYREASRRVRAMQAATAAVAMVVRAAVASQLVQAGATRALSFSSRMQSMIEELAKVSGSSVAEARRTESPQLLRPLLEPQPPPVVAALDVSVNSATACGDAAQSDWVECDSASVSTPSSDIDEAISILDTSEEEGLELWPSLPQPLGGPPLPGVPPQARRPPPTDANNLPVVRACLGDGGPATIAAGAAAGVEASVLPTTPKALPPQAARPGPRRRPAPPCACTTSTSRAVCPQKLSARLESLSQPLPMVAAPAPGESGEEGGAGGREPAASYGQKAPQMLSQLRAGRSRPQRAPARPVDDVSSTPLPSLPRPARRIGMLAEALHPLDLRAAHKTARPRSNGRQKQGRCEHRKATDDAPVLPAIKLPQRYIKAAAASGVRGTDPR